MKVPSNSIGDVIDFCKKELLLCYDANEAGSMIRILFKEYCGLDATALAIRRHDHISESELLLILDAVKELKKFRPIQYITGICNFYDLEFLVNPAVLIPRPETEELVSNSLKEIEKISHSDQIRVLDIGTGSGCIAITLKKNCERAAVTAIDNSLKALETARENATRNKVHLDFKMADMLNPEAMHILGDFSVIVSNPPYVRESEKIKMHPNVLEHEPASALFVPDTDPLLFYRAIFHFAATHLIPGGFIMLEINEELGTQTAGLAREITGFCTTIVKDLSGKDRFVHCAR